MPSTNHPDATRRDFLKKASIASFAAVGSPALLFAAEPTTTAAKISLAPNEIILFQGDSITDAGRKKDPKDADVPNTSGTLGSGYAYLAAAELLLRHAEKKPLIYNRGISGNKVYQLAERWDHDCLDLKPTVLSILIGVNDFWHTLTSNYQGTVKTYTDDYKALLDRTRQRLPSVKLIIGEPFAVTSVKAVDEKWYPAFQDYQAAARSLAAQYNATLIPYQHIFDQAQKRAPGAYWTGDGVHPSVAGNQLMARAWLDTFKS
ncbi:SGNH/GDSL hydrolase family protein [Hymenobacter sp. GOD-10R]|uniref:SGNH/GDSL hydrolase family protein n=1 Tax=Hymenobacter sp. GOD-10R TaxID=3093922 RepID=UPI002D768CC1|nr:SGNH/GDSL hydrolase family protein [Hymenobacter sp. GOD-10R]WRQ27676.1 SGNH/GDSL hydrolase family protein [Hymenobacter sp. GOD-10R]